MTYNDIFEERQNALDKLFTQVFRHGQWPNNGLTPLEIEALLCKVSLADSNNYERAGAGEREGRVFSNMVRERNFGFAHGVGRSGDLGEAQPKASGSNVLNNAAHCLVRAALLEAGFRSKGVLLVPLCTGMSVNLLAQALSLKSVAWLRADEKSVPKALALYGCQIIVIDGVRRGDVVETNLSQLRDVIVEVDAVISTTSCFAPRIPDRLREISKMCHEYKKLHIVNNAYGIHSNGIMKEISVCHDIDYVVSSLDKNFMVPVGSSIIYSAKHDMKFVSASYAGRAGNQGNIDILITLLEMGSKGWERLRNERIEMYDYFVARLAEIAEIKVVKAPGNEISFYYYFNDEKYRSEDVAARLFRASISGSKALIRGKTLQIGSITLKDFGRGAEYDAPDYITCAAAIGITRTDVDIYVTKLKQILADIDRADHQTK